MTILGFLFGRLNRLLPGRTGLSKGLSFGLIGWLFMGLLFFPLIDLGPFAVGQAWVSRHDVSRNGSDLQRRAGYGLCRT